MFRKPIVRWVTSVFPLVWGAVELALGNPGWAIAFGAAGAYAFWQLIIKGPDQPS